MLSATQHLSTPVPELLAGGPGVFCSSGTRWPLVNGQRKGTFLYVEPFESAACHKTVTEHTTDQGEVGTIRASPAQLCVCVCGGGSPTRAYEGAAVLLNKKLKLHL